MSFVETIKHAAVKSVDGEVVKGKHHAECFHTGHTKGIKMSQRADDQGFVTSSGRYVDRKEAAKVAVFANQVAHSTVILFSEDLWSKHSGGRFHYDAEIGYYE